MNETIRLVLIAYAAVCIAAFLCYLPKLFGFRYAFRKPSYKRAKEKRRIAVIVPARHESKIIGDLFASIEKQTYDRACFDVCVIVKEEDDPTVEMANAIGARVFVVPEQTRKGEALDGFFNQLGDGRSVYDAFVIVDADAVIAPDYLEELNNALEHDYDIFITRKFAKNYLGDRKDRSVFSNCSALTWPIIDDLGNLYRMHKEIPLNLCGQGMMLRRSVIDKLGGWPYRTLTEDYELKLDSLLHGYRSMYYPYAVIYTEEALSHDENYARRIRWLTGYAQCDKKYKKEILRQAKERGKLNSGEREYFFGVVPIIVFAAMTFLTIFTGGGLAIYYALSRQPYWFYASWLLVFMPFLVMYVLLFLFGVLAMCSDTEAFRALSGKEKLFMLLFNPFYLLEYIPIYLKSVRYARKDSAPEWRETARITYDSAPEQTERSAPPPEEEDK